LLGSGKLIFKQVINFHRIGPLATFFLTCLIAPVAEECFFRYLIFANFAKNNFLPYLLSFFGFIIMHVGWLVDATKDV
jgi:membrane protease YdiL (CAAX protease family)